MNEPRSPSPIGPLSRRTLLHGGAVVAAAGVLSSCTGSPAPSGSSSSKGSAATPPIEPGVELRVGPNVRVSNDEYGVHLLPMVAINPRDPRQLLAICEVSPTAEPEFIASYLSSDGGTSWHSGGLPPQPASGPAGDDLSVAFDANGRGYVCAARAGHGPNLDPNNPDVNRGVYVWRTDDGGRSFSSPVTILEGQYCDHPWLTTGRGSTATGGDVYVAWGAGSALAPTLGFTRSTDAGKTFEPPRTILAESGTPSLVSAGPELAAGPDGLIVAVTDWTVQEDPAGDQIGQVVAVCSTDGGRTFGTPVHLGSESAAIALPDNVLPNSMPTVAVSPLGEVIYAAFTQHTPGSTHSDIVVTASHDRGRTWSTPVEATPDDAAIYFQPSLAVDAAGRVALAAFALTSGRVDRILLVSAPGELRFGQPLRVTTHPFDPHSSMRSGGKHGAWFLGDCQGMASTGDTFLLLWNDTRTGKLDIFASRAGP